MDYPLGQLGATKDKKLRTPVRNQTDQQVNRGQGVHNKITS